ncbi:MAG: 2-amino-4-hydroxy-6-hydroxymethyldihydropteridine diphosphokinase [Actinomycetes bacterium]
MRAHLALGSNLGDRLANLQGALDGLAATQGIEVVARSSVYETDPVGGPVQDDYLNAVVEVDTTLTPQELLAVCGRLEQAAHRVRLERWGPRTLDVDVLLVGDLVVATDDLEVPHPRMWERTFVLAPLHDVAPDLVTVPDGGWTGVRRAPVALRLPG